MSIRSIAAAASAALLVSAPAAGFSQPEIRRAAATLVDADGSQRGRATFTQRGKHIRVEVRVAGARPGAKGLHVHTVGQCRAPDFTSAGGHWNPGRRQHGRNNALGPHAGDLMNLAVAADGSGRLVATIPKASLSGGEHPLLDADGAALVLHAEADDYRTDPSGQSGARFACGVIRRP